MKKSIHGRLYAIFRKSDQAETAFVMTMESDILKAFSGPGKWKRRWRMIQKVLGPVDLSTLRILFDAMGGTMQRLPFTPMWLLVTKEMPE
jgi:hypothetical protein